MYLLKLLSPKGTTSDIPVQSSLDAIRALSDHWIEFSDGSRLMYRFGLERASGQVWQPFWNELPNPFRLGRDALEARVYQALAELNQVQPSKAGCGENLINFPK